MSRYINLSRKICGSLLISLVVAGLPLTAQAETAAPTRAQVSDATLADIVVTAQKRSQIAEDIPISLYAVSGAELEKQGITSIQDFGNNTAGVNIAQSNPGNMRLTIRGAGDVSSSNQASSVNGFYIDETVMSYVPGHMPEVGLWDIERIEVLRGPQGTLFGDGSEGGTLRVITKKPDSTQFFGRYDGGVESTSGGGTGYNLGGAVNIPLIKDVLAVTMAVRNRKSEGWIDIPDLNLKDSNQGNLTDGRFALRYTPSAALTIDASLLYHTDKLDGDQLGSAPGELNPAAVGHGAGPVKTLSTQDDKSTIAALTIDYDFGFASLISASGATVSNSEAIRDITAGAVAVFPPFFIPGNVDSTRDRFESKAFTQELRLVSNGHQKLDWTVGAYYKDETRVVNDDFTFNVPAIHYIDHPQQLTHMTAKSWAIFADGDYQLTDRWSLQAGLRYFSDKKDFDFLQLTGSHFPLGFPPAGTTTATNADSTATSPKIGVSYKLNSKAMLFAKYSEGFRAATINSISLVTYPQASAAANPDKLSAFEVGLKATPWADGYINVYLYANDWTDLQVPIRTYDNVWTYNVNAGKAKMQGLEFEAGGKVAPGLRMSLTYAYVDSSIIGNVYDNIDPPRLIISDGSKLPFVSKNKATLSINYETQLTDGLAANIDTRYRVSSPTFSDVANNPLYINDSVRNLFLSVGISGKWGSLSAYGDNLLNRDDTLAKFPPVGPALYVMNAYVRPRNIGLVYKGTV